MSSLAIHIEQWILVCKMSNLPSSHEKIFALVLNVIVKNSAICIGIATPNLDRGFVRNMAIKNFKRGFNRETI